MLDPNKLNFAEDIESFQFYGLDAPEDIFALDSMSGSGKQPRYDMSLLAMSMQYPSLCSERQANEIQGFPPDSGAFGPYVQPAYAAHMSNQQDLAALPESFGLDFDDGTTYHAYEYPSAARIGSVASSMRPTETPTSGAHVQPLKAVVNGNQLPSKKRKASFDSVEENAPPAKKIAVALQDTNGEYHDLSGEPSPYSSFVPTPAAMPAQPIIVRPSGSPRPPSHHYSTSNTSQISIPATAPYTPTVSPSFTTANTEHSPRAPATPIARPASTSSPYDASNPTLVRTSTIPQQSPTSMAPCVGMPGHTHAFNPYTMYSPNAKARLTLEGDLHQIAKNWSPEELEARRKIVVFDRRQKGNEIFANFKVVSQKDWSRHPGTVNCIWWKEKNDAFVTSVDTIALLEELVHVRFTVEEKNRIRRNLEGFKPLTVSKAKADSEEFFKVIMGFPNPKPRNIEKDVKVFPWRILPTALCKIISKYSASYASTASALSGAPAQLFRPFEGPHEYQYPPSPAHEYNVTMAPSAMGSTYDVEPPQGRMSAPVTPVPNLQLVPVAPSYEMHHQYSYGPMQVPHSHVSYGTHTMTAPPTQGPHFWNAGYVPEGSMSMAPSSAPPTATAYPRGMIETADFGHVQAAHHMRHH